MALEKSKSIEAELQTLAGEDTHPNETTPPISFCTKARLVLTNITVEPLLFFYVLPSVMGSLATQNLNLEKACRVNLGYDPMLCDALALRNASGYNQTDEQQVQKLVSSMYAVKNVIQSFVPSLILLFLGSWSDRHRRRKPCMVLPIIGEVICTVGFILCVFFEELPLEVAIFFEAVPPSLTGGWFAMFMGVFSYISGITSVQTRTLRIGAVNIFSNVSLTIGIALSGVLYKTIGFYGVYSLSLAMYTVGLLYGMFVVKEVPSVEEKNPEDKDRKGFLADFFNVKYIKETIKVAFKEGKRNRKKRICTIMVLVMVIIGPHHGEMNVVYLFVRYKFGWNEIDYSIYATCNFIAHLFGTLFSLMFFSKYLKVDDAVLGMISTSSKICGAIMYAFAPTGAFFYLGILIEILNGTSFIAMRSIMSKLVPADELGKINSLFGVCEALMPLVYGPMYSILYSYTIQTFPGAFYLLGGGLLIPSVLIFFWLYTEHRRDLREGVEATDENEDFLKKNNEAQAT